MGEKPAEAPKPQEAPKPAETTAQPPATPNEALESAYYDAPMSDFHQYRAKVTGYSPAPNRYFVRMTAPVGKVPTSDWNQQKATVTGYTACSNQYYATRARLAYHPADKRFGSFSGVNMSFDGVEIKEQTTQAPPPSEPPKPSGTLPKGMDDAPQTSASSGDGKSRQEQLEEYEKDYLQRIEQEKAEREQAYQEALQAEVEERAKQTRGSLPKGFEPAPESEPEPPKPKGTLPKGF
ncbi:trans-sialidase protein [Marine Group I thaumarchaeote SCGC AAA799-E16]|nr:trans-sialidase protein [Marine Group I thaumarchaeote SCGC AAA799-E16]